MDDMDIKTGDATELETICIKVVVPQQLCAALERIAPITLRTAQQMLKDRKLQSSRYWKNVPCVIAKALTRKYQKNPKCKEIHRIVIPICGDKGKQVKIVDGGIRVPALFKKAVLPVVWPRPVHGFVRQVEFFKRDGQWLVSICYSVKAEAPIKVTGVVGVDRNSVGNIAVMADPQTGKVRKLGVNPAATKRVFRGRRKNLQSAGKTRMLHKIKRKQSRRMTYENHRASKAIVDYAATHCRAIALENLGSVREKGSKIRSYSENNQWAFAQLETFIKYKAALRGVPVVLVDPAYTSQRCSRCGSIHKPNGKQYHCLVCGHNEHRDANAAFNIAQRGIEGLSVLSGSGLSVSEPGLIGDPQAGKERVA